MSLKVFDRCITFLPKIFVILLTSFFLLLPFHAFGVTVINSLFFDPEFSAPSIIKAWKEILLLLFFAFSGLYFAIEYKKILSLWDRVDSLVVAFSFILLLVSVFNFSAEKFSLLLYGIKYDLFPLWLFFSLKKISEISSVFANIDTQKILRYMAYIGISVVFFGFVFLLLSPETLVWLGYSPDHSFSAFQRPLAYCQKISFTDICRAQSTLSGPNQLGSFLLFLMPLFLQLHYSEKKYYWISVFLASGIILLFTFSRAAWIGAFFGVIFFLWSLKNFPFRKVFLSMLIGFPIIAGILVSFFLPDLTHKIINRTSSTSEHYEKTMEGISAVLQNPLGDGLGSAGAASKYTGSTGVIPENWYLQIALEGGIIVLILFCILIVLVFLHYKKNRQMLFLAAAFLGISIMSLFLHAWESSTVAYIFWGFAGLLWKKNK